MLGTAAAAFKTSLLHAQGSTQRFLGGGGSAYGERSPFETAARQVRAGRYPSSGSRTPLQDLRGIITPSALHFERHHAGVPDIDPSTHHLLIHGLVDRPLVLTMDDLRRLPSVSRICFLECSGNSGGMWREATSTTPQSTHGMTSCSEWTGVQLSVLLREAGLRPGARWLVAEGADACRLTRSVPLEKALDDTLVAFGQNGEALRPEQGYPLRLFVPGWEGNISVKWLRRIELVDQPYMTREETSKYTDLMPDGQARQFTFMMEAKVGHHEPLGWPAAGRRRPSPDPRNRMVGPWQSGASRGVNRRGSVLAPRPISKSPCSRSPIPALVSTGHGMAARQPSNRAVSMRRVMYNQRETSSLP